jgi:hypothetical protein
MGDNFTRVSFDTVIHVDKIITMFYMELSKSFQYDGEQHDFWEMVYIDKGEMLCTADKSRFILKSGEMTFHKPNEFHNLSGDNQVAPNVSIITFECKSRSMNFFDGKIENGCFVCPSFTAPLDSEQKARLASYEGKEIILGARPENIVQDDNGYITIDVVLNENLGQTTLVHGTANHHKITAKFRDWCSYKKGDSVKASINRIHFFDKETTNAIR